MKTKITFFSLILFVTVFTFGQNVPEKKRGIFAEKWKESHLNASAPDVNKSFHKRAIQNKRPDTQNHSLKSAPANKQRLDSLIIYIPDDITGQLVAHYKDEFTYDASGNQTHENSYSWDEITSQWVGDWKAEYTYDANGILIQEIDFTWDENISQWVAGEKVEYTYDANGNLTQTLDYYQDPDTSEWVENSKEEYTYDGAGNLTLYNGYNWDQDTGQWVRGWKGESTYDGAGNLTQTIDYYWDVFTSQWVGDWKGEYTYDANGNLTLEIYFSWDPYTSQWVGDWRHEYIYDATRNLTQALTYDWDEITSQWIAEEKEELTYNYEFSFNDLILPYFLASDYGFYFNHMVTEIEVYTKDFTDDWVQSGKTMVYYSEHIATNVIDIETKNIVFYPNPVSDYLNFRFTGKSNSGTFELFDILGRRIISKIIANNEQLSLNDLNKGMYLYIITIDGNRQSGKLIKE